MLRLAHAHELLDGPLPDRAALRDNLRDLRRYNRLLGGARLSRRAVERLLDGATGEVGVLDVGTGAADIPLALSGRRPGRPYRFRILAADSRPEVLEAARLLDSRLDRDEHVTLVVADGRALPWPDGTFDVAHASLVLHHLEPPDAVRFLAELSRVSRRGIVVNDVVRGRHWWVAAWLGARIVTGNRLTRNDAPLSVRRAYTVAEARALLDRAGLEPVATERGLLGHRYAIAAVPRSARGRS